MRTQVRISRCLSLISLGPSSALFLIFFKDVLAKHCGTLLDYFDEAWQSQSHDTFGTFVADSFLILNGNKLVNL